MIRWKKYCSGAFLGDSPILCIHKSDQMVSGMNTENHEEKICCLGCHCTKEIGPFCQPITWFNFPIHSCGHKNTQNSPSEKFLCLWGWLYSTKKCALQGIIFSRYECELFWWWWWVLQARLRTLSWIVILASTCLLIPWFDSSAFISPLPSQ